MPELPDVEGFRRVLERHVVGRPIDGVEVIDTGVVRAGSANRLRRELTGRTFASARRHGKWLIGPLRTKRQHHKEEPSLLFHFGMTGLLVWVDTDEPRHHHDRLALMFGHHELRYRDMRKLQGVRLAEQDEQLEALLDELGPDAAEISVMELRHRLASLRRQLKSALMDQSVIAGLGNLLSDEVLWRSRLRPTRSTHDLTAAEYRRLHGRMSTVLRDSMRHGRVPTTSGWLTGRRDDDGASCPRCGSTLRRSRVGGRRTTWCPNCQS